MILNSNFNYNDANFNFSQHPVIPNTNIINKNINFINPNYPNYSSINNINNVIPGATNFSNQIHPYANPSLAYPSHINTLINTFNAYNPKISNNFNMQYSKNFFLNQEKLELECICDKQTFESKNDLKQCILCHKYQHIECIHQAQEITPYLCFNCQFKNVHFYLRWKKTILPAKEFIYKKKWEDDISLLKQGTKKFEFYLNLNELNTQFNNDNNNSHYLALLCLTNNGRPFQLGFPDNINIQINNKQFFFTESKGFKRPLLLALDNTPFYSNKKRHLITSEKYEIPNLSNFFFLPKNNNGFQNRDKYMQKVTISFANFLENYRGSEFESVEVRHYIFYIGLFQEIKIPPLNILRSCNDLKQYFNLFKSLYKEKVKKVKWSKVSNYVTLGNDEMNMNLISNVCKERILHPIRGLFCQHSEVLDFGECCKYITSSSQVYKCFICHKPFNIMYIDDMSEKIFNEYRTENYSQIYYTNKFEFIKGEIINDGNEKNDKINNINHQLLSARATINLLKKKKYEYENEIDKLKDNLNIYNQNEIQLNKTNEERLNIINNLKL